jgi:hypothetical protein
MCGVPLADKVWSNLGNTAARGIEMNRHRN